jgi:hypothetical protein
VATNPFDALADSTQKQESNPFDALGGAARQVTTGIGNALDSQRWAVAKAITGKDDPDEQRAEYRRRLGLPGDEERKQLGGFRGGLDDFALDTVTDPLSLLGPEEYRLGKYAAGGLRRAGSAITRTVAPEFGNAVNAAAKSTRDGLMGMFLHGGDARAKYGAEPYAQTVGETQKGQKRGHDFSQIVQERNNAILAPHDDKARVRILRAASGVTVPGLSPAESDAATALRNNYRTEFIARADKGGRIVARGFKKTGNGGTTRTIGGVEPETLEAAQGVPPADKRMSDALKALGEQQKRLHPDYVRPFNRDEAIAGRMEQLQAEEDLRAEPFRQALAQFGGKIYNDGSGELADVPARHKTTARFNPRTRIGGGALDEIAQHLRDNHGMDDVTTSDVTDFFAGKRKTKLELRQEAERQIDRAYGTSAPKAPVAAEDRKPRVLVRQMQPAFNTPEWAKKYATETTGAEPTLGRENFTKNYIPQPTREGVAEAAKAKKKGEAFNVLTPFDPNALHRSRSTIPLNDQTLPQYLEAMQRATKNTGRQIGAAEARTALRDVIADKPELQKLGQVETEKSKIEQFLDPLKKVVQYPRAGVVSLTPAHMGNVARLAALHDPGALPGALKTLVKALPATGALGKRFEDPAKLRELFESGTNAGIMEPPGEDRADVFKSLLRFNPLQRAAGGALGGVATGEINSENSGQGLTSPQQTAIDAFSGAVGGAALPHYTNLINRATFTFDDAVKQEMANRMIAAGEKPMVAGRKAAQRMVDYNNTGNATKVLKYVAPFATFRSAIPGAVAQGIARNPVRAEAINRATGGLFLGGTNTNDDGKTTKSFGPVEDVSRMTNPYGIAEYGRAMLGEPYRAGLTALGITRDSIDQRTGKTRGQKDYFTYGLGVVPGTPEGNKYLLNAALAGVPGASDELEALGLGRFGASQTQDGLAKLLYKFTGVAQR